MDDLSVAYSIGHLEEWISKAQATGLDYGPETLAHLKLVEDAYHEMRRNLDMHKRIIGEVKAKIDVASTL